MNAEFEFDRKSWSDMLDKLNKKIKEPQKDPVFQGIVTIASFKDIVQHFEDENGPNGNWKERSQPYKSWIEAQGKTKILQVSGILRGSITPGKGKFKTNSSGILLYSKVPYAQKHDEGLEGMPKRSFMWLSSKAIKNIVAQVSRWLAE